MPSLTPSVTGRGGAFRPLVDKPVNGSRLTQALDGNGTLVYEAIGDALVAGYGVLIAPTSDGGAISVTVYDGDERFRTYATNHDEFRDALTALKDKAARYLVGTKPATLPKSGK